MIRVRRLFISPGHNFVGHHEKPPGQNAMTEVDRIECVAGRGIRGDRYFDHKKDYKGQITFFSAETFSRLQHELDAPAAEFSATRRNVLLEDVDLNSLVGKEFEIQGIRFFGTEQCKPCHWMNRVVHPRAEEWLHNRGGLRAQILTDGVLRAEREPG